MDFVFESIAALNMMRRVAIGRYISFSTRYERMESRPQMALRKSDTPPDMMMRRSKVANNLSHSPRNTNQTSLTEG
jgi:hypothetical protein